jgi:AcrR family transcriptional regulator
MARKPARERPAPRRRAAPPATARAARGGTERDRIIEALMDLLAEQPFERIGFGDIAGRAGLSLAQLRGEFSSALAILAAHIKEIDRKVLAGGDSDMAEEPARERLFDVLMRRLEALSPYKQAVRSLLRSSARNPGLALALNGMGVRSQQWMLTAADIKASGPKGMMRSQGLALLFARVLCVWVDDQDPGLARTMAALDRELARGERWSGFLDDVCMIPEAFCRPGGWRARRRSERDEAAAA